MLGNIRVVLVETFHPGNIGSVARAMKTMGLHDLVLVSPRVFPSETATRLAVGAADILESARVVESLAEAIADCRLTVAASARRRGHEWPLLDAAGCGRQMVAEARQAPAALVFGPERMGLSNEQLQSCTHRVEIAANPEYSSLNLAAAVQILTYEIRQAHLALEGKGSGDATGELPEYPSSEAMEHFYAHLEQTLRDTGFLIRQHPGELMVRLRRLFNRARPEAMELNILRGILSSVQKAAGVRSRDDS